MILSIGYRRDWKHQKGGIGGIIWAGDRYTVYIVFSQIYAHFQLIVHSPAWALSQIQI